MNYYSYRISRDSDRVPLYGGCLHANSMEDAIKKVIIQHHINVKMEHHPFSYKKVGNFLLNGVVVVVYIYANAEEFFEEN